MGGKKEIQMRNKVKSYVTYDNYYGLIKLLNKENQKEIALAMMQYMFEDIEPNYDEESDLYAVWNSISLGLKTSKKQSLNVQKRYEETEKEETNEDTKQPTKKDTKKDTKSATKKGTNNISYFLFLISNYNFNILKNKYTEENIKTLKDTIINWLEYKDERREEYKERGIKSLLKQIENNADKYGIDEMIKLIEECMASNYKGIIFEKLEKKAKPQTQKMSWQEKEEMRMKEVRENFLRGE